MGLFFKEAGAEQRGKKPKTIKIASLDKSKLNCSTCPLDKAEGLGSPKMKPSGAEKPLIYILGESPSGADDESGRQFAGSAGAEIRDRIPSRFRKEVRYNHTIRCRHHHKEGPEQIETESCRHLQVEDIERSKPKVIIGVGKVALKWALDVSGIGVWRGRRIPLQVGKHRAWFYPVMELDTLVRPDRRMGDANRTCFERDLKRIFTDIDNGLPEPEVEDPKDWKAGIQCVTDFGIEGVKQIDDWLAWIKDEDHGIDLETNQLRPYNSNSKILTLAMGTFEKTLAFPWKHPEARWAPKHEKIIREAIRNWLLNGTGLKIAHNAKFEQEWLRAEFGPDFLFTSEWGDTLGQAHALDCRYGKDLEDLTIKHFGFNLKAQSQVDVKNMEGEPLSRILPYNGGDSKYCHAIYWLQDWELGERGLTQVYQKLNAATPSIVQMQAKGTVRDVPRIIELQEKWSTLEKQAYQAILKQKDVVAFVAKKGKEFNPGSNPQLVEFFRDHMAIPHPSKKRGKPGAYSVDEDALLKLRHPLAKMILEYRSRGKLQDYLIPLLDDPRGKHVYDDGLVHANYSQYVTQSGRLNCTDPNQQNYPRRKFPEIRSAVGCPPDHLFCAFDYGQLEARIIASVTGDPVLIAEIKNQQDIHGDWTDEIGGKFAPALLKAARKAIRDSIKQYWTFANFYGNVLEAVAYDLSVALEVNITPQALKPIFDKFWAKYARVLEWQDELMGFYWKNGYVETFIGQRRYEPMNRNEIINHPIQGTAGHLVIDAQRRLSREAWETDTPALQPLMNIHDDLSFYLPITQVDDLIPRIAERMVVTPFDFKVPLSVEVKVGRNWHELEEIGTFYTGDFQ